MFLGHYALGLAAKRLAPQTSLGTLFVAPTLADLLWPLFLLIGWEQARIVPASNPFLVLWLDHYPWSHSLLMLAAWGVLFGLLYWAFRHWLLKKGNYARGAIVIALLVISHWLLDFITHRPDLPLCPCGAEYGLGLWYSFWGTLIVELVLFVAGIVIYLATTDASDGIGRWGFWVLVLLLAGSYIVTLFMPPPGSITALAVGAIIFGWLFVLIAWWVDRHRQPVAPPSVM